jgi:hypothetical protein
MRKGFLIYEEMRKYLTLYDLAKRSWTTGAALAMQASISPVLPLLSLMFTSNEEMAGPANHVLLKREECSKKVVFDEMSMDPLGDRLMMRVEVLLRPPSHLFLHRLPNSSQIHSS